MALEEERSGKGTFSADSTKLMLWWSFTPIDGSDCRLQLNPGIFRIGFDQTKRSGKGMSLAGSTILVLLWSSTRVATAPKSGSSFSHFDGPDCRTQLHPRILRNGFGKENVRLPAATAPGRKLAIATFATSRPRDCCQHQNPMSKACYFDI